MRRRAATTAMLAALLIGGVAGCSEERETAPTPLPADCDAPAVALPDGSCFTPGIAPDGCDAGFEHDGEYGCEPILPAQPCGYGLMAIPGETECRPVMPCGDGRWGDIPVDATTLHVDAAYAGGGSDGSEARPFTLIGEAVTAAAPGALIAVAEGRYQQDVIIEGKPLRLWGRCPERVEIAGAGVEAAAVTILAGAHGTELRGFAIGGPGAGVGLSGSRDVVLKQLWVRDNGNPGINVERTLGESSVRIVGSLVESNVGLGIQIGGCEASIEQTVVRATAPLPSSLTFGRGINIQTYCSAVGCDLSARSNVTVRGSLVEQNHEYGIFIGTADALIAGSVVRSTASRPSDLTQGFGIAVRVRSSVGPYDPAMRANATISGSLLEHNHQSGLFVLASDAVVERTVVRNTLPQEATQLAGRGINVQTMCPEEGCLPASRANISIRECLLADNHNLGLLVMGSDASIEGSVVRGTLPQASDQRSGRGISIQLPCIQTGCESTGRSNATVRSTLVDNNYDMGMFVMGSDAIIEGSVLRATAPRASDGLYGDGLLVLSEFAPASVQLSTMLIEDSARAGVASFGGEVMLNATAVRCAAFALNGEIYEGRDAAFDDAGDNACGCPAAEGACKVVSVGLEPPEPLLPK